MTGWWSQKFAAEGAASAEGISKQLGRSSLDPLTILVREAAQNSWDARRSDEEPVDFRVELRRFGESGRVWRRILSTGLLPAAGIDLTAAMQPDRYLLIISDRGTRGLGGPLRADMKPPEGESPDFVQFLRNVGEARDQVHGGGTYGFGKGILYSSSAARTIVVDTNAVLGDTQPRRMMGATLGAPYYVGGQRFTGRHWWGEAGSDGVIDPVLGEGAQWLAGELGFPGFGAGEYGTDIAIVGFDTGVAEYGDDRPRTAVEAGEFLASSILWNLWPKMGSHQRPARMRFSVAVDGQDIPVPNPAMVPVLQPFVESLDAIERGEGEAYTRTVKPKIAGTTAISIALAPARSTTPVVELARPFAGHPHHVCRMRTPELVVDYVEQQPHPDAAFCFGGVFRASEDGDSAFAASEPPTHDAWVAQGLTGSDRGVVSGLPRRMQRACGESASAVHKWVESVG